LLVEATSFDVARRKEPCVVGPWQLEARHQDFELAGLAR